MQVARFEKVSCARFASDTEDTFHYAKQYTYSSEFIQSIYDNIQLPSRATTGSAGYDFKSPFDISLHPGATVKVPSGIRVKINEGWWLACVPRSSLGFKYQLRLDNTVGVIDSDYYYSNNEGHIFFKLTNCGDKALTIKHGDNFVQGIFLPYGVTYDDQVTAARDGGIGSTGA
jgi:dUTP pyrophosphatase